MEAYKTPAIVTLVILYLYHGGTLNTIFPGAKK